jgi:peptidoglycan hydrolase-like protein with peptidoglycan-binding domain
VYSTGGEHVFKGKRQMNRMQLGILLAAGMTLTLGGCAFGPRQTASGYAAPAPFDPQVAQLQRSLDANGANLRVDGVMGPDTAAALRDYQQQHGLQPTGQLDAQTRQSLNLPA